MEPTDSTAVGLDTMKAVIFDMDGVITDTATLHARAWKRLFDEYLEQRKERDGEEFQPFDPDDDYRRYVDGKPRYDGVSSFLESRGISFPYGDPSDEPGKETVCGLGNQKNEYFLQLLSDEGLDAYPSSITFIRSLREKGVKTAVISSSRNCEQVLKAAGVRDLFEVKVDGVDMADAGLNGKPAPDIFLEAARRLGAQPGETAVVEDALSGVEAGRRGEFRLVIGVARQGHAEELKKHGADVVVGDLAELHSQTKNDEGRSGAVTRPIRELPSALDRKQEIFSRLQRGTHAIFLDYDGTLTPIVDDPDEATLSEQGRAVLERLSDHYTVAVISGRDLQDVRDKVGLPEIVYAGSHGFDIVGPGGRYRDQQRGERFLPALDRAERQLEEDLSDIAGARVERKQFSIAVHYRMVEDDQVAAVEERVDRVAAQESGLRKSHGKKVFELGPDVDWDKGKAVLWLLETLYMDGWKTVPLFIGDDLTDENAFRAIRGWGVTIVVGVGERETAAEYCLCDTGEVLQLLEGLVPLAERQARADPWTLAYEGFDPETEGVREALCTVGNGYFATRGAAPEAIADDVHYPGTYVAGCYNRLTSNVAGQTIENESLVNVPNWLPLTFKLDKGDWFDPAKVD
ncbi:MAG: trehalose-phosphatase, partial [Chloroflexota bacterium]